MCYSVLQPFCSDGEVCFNTNVRYAGEVKLEKEKDIELKPSLVFVRTLNVEIPWYFIEY